jgi:predicted ATPase
MADNDSVVSRLTGAGDRSISNDNNSLSSSFRRSRITRTSDVTSEISMDFNTEGGELQQGLALSRSTIYNPSQRGRFQNSSISELTVNKLRFNKLGLHGREKEEQTIQTSLQRLSNANQLVLISGESGVGKTALAKSVGKSFSFVKAGTSKIDPSALCLLGKFHQAHAQQEPYTAFVKVFQQFVGILLPLKESVSTLDQDKFKAVQSDLTTELGPQELSDLVSPFPELLEVLSSETIAEITTASAQGADTHDKVKSRLHHAFRNFLRVISRHFSPLVLILDDLQWADLASLSLLELMLADSKTSKTLIIGCYRSDEVDETHMFSKIVRDLRLRKDEFEGVVEITDIEIGNLGATATRMILSDLLSTEDALLHDLAEVCYAKTNGNCFFLISFIIMLFNQQFLEFNLGTFKWKWDIQEIKGGTAATDNIADLVEVRMASLDNDILLAIKLAVCLGARFQYDILGLVYEAFCESESAQSFDVVVDNLIRENILQEDGWPYYRWVHDKIQGTIDLSGCARMLAHLPYSL